MTYNMALLWQMTRICLKSSEQMTYLLYSVSVQWGYSVLSLSAVKESSSSVSVVFFVGGAVLLLFRTDRTGQLQIAWTCLLDCLVSLELQIGGEKLGVLRMGRGKALKFS